MSLLTIAERKGREEGLEEGLKQTISDILEIKFGKVGLALFAHVEQVVAIETLQNIRAGLKQVQSLAEADALIRAHAKGQSSRGPAA